MAKPNDVLDGKKTISRDDALDRLREAVPGMLDRGVEHEWIMAAREAGAGWGEIEEALTWDPRRGRPRHAAEE